MGPRMPLCGGDSPLIGVSYDNGKAARDQGKDLLCVQCQAGGSGAPMCWASAPWPSWALMKCSEAAALEGLALLEESGKLKGQDELSPR